jgi:hypothetical protein
MCQRYELYPESEELVVSKEIIEYDRTNSGKWYAKKIQERNKSWEKEGIPEDIRLVTVYLDTEPEFPEGIFEPNQLPNWTSTSIF